MEGHSERSTKNKRRNLNTDPSSGKREMGRTNISTKGEARVHRPAGLSDLPKNTKRRVGNGRKKGK